MNDMKLLNRRLRSLVEVFGVRMETIELASRKEPNLLEVQESRNGLKLWNGRGQGKFQNEHFNVAANTQKEALDLIAKASGSFVSANEVSKYYSPMWGNSMKGVVPDKPGVWVEYRMSGKVERIL
jgi:hypothetical protein